MGVASARPPPARPPSSSPPSSGSARAAGGPARPRASALLRARPAGRAAELWAGLAGPAGARGVWGKELRLLFPFASCRVQTGTRLVFQAVGRRSWPLSISGYRAPISQRVPAERNSRP
ncbi:uncharacterized protein LOC113906997 [Bos indicus x Bos taurus]|uniref:uncharacterized protein LOC113906997 n=1 Tax=Bos indicus x Bos taurus TaxID=30522 RepID=UPI000F7D09DD|nr:uncharacterized protein LOC113906997 [Bos indicus x Bos taurus]